MTVQNQNSYSWTIEQGKVDLNFSETDAKCKLTLKDGAEIDIPKQRIIGLPKAAGDKSTISDINNLFKNTYPTLTSHGDHNYSIQFITSSKRGGAVFNALSHKVVGKVQDAEEGSLRMIEPGLNLEGTCQNSKCRAFNEIVIIPKGKSNFNVIKEADKTACKICKMMMRDVNNVVFYHCKYSIKGLRYPNENEEGKPETVEISGIAPCDRTWTSFKPNDNRHWRWVEVEVEVIEEKKGFCLVQ